jgi:DNA-binding transcriptional MerR regulator
MEQIVFSDYVVQYGVLGVVAFTLAYVTLSQYKRLLKKNDALEVKVDKLQEEMLTLLAEERDRLADLIRENTQALQDLQKTILQFMINNNRDRE